MENLSHHPWHHPLYHMSHFHPLKSGQKSLRVVSCCTTRDPLGEQDRDESCCRSYSCCYLYKRIRYNEVGGRWGRSYILFRAVDYQTIVSRSDDHHIVQHQLWPILSSQASLLGDLSSNCKAFSGTLEFIPFGSFSVSGPVS